MINILVCSYLGFAWGKLVKIEAFNNNRFPTGYLYEDTIIPFLIFSQCKKIKIMSNCFYGYRANENGIVNKSKSSIRSCDTAFIFEEVLYQMKENQISIDYEIYKFLLNCQFSYVTYGRIKNMNKNVQKAVFFKLCTYMDSINIELEQDENVITRNLEKSFKNKNFKLWKLSSIILNYCN